MWQSLSLTVTRVRGTTMASTPSISHPKVVEQGRPEQALSPCRASLSSKTTRPREPKTYTQFEPKAH